MTANTSFASDPRPIGVFDSGVGGLTVLKALMEDLPGQHFIYLGDTARVPYGTKSADTVKTYSTGLARLLLERDVKMIVIACNTASAHAAAAVAAMAAPVPVIGMVDTAADAALEVTKGNIMVMATQSTVLAQSYDRALMARDAGLNVRSVPCQVLVSLAEEGWTHGTVADAVLAEYIGGYFGQGSDDKPDTIILGCTHFPLLKQAIAKLIGHDVRLVDTGAAAAAQIARDYGPFPPAEAGDVRFYVTDSVERFKPMAQRFLGIPDHTIAIEQIDLTSYKAVS